MILFYSPLGIWHVFLYSINHFRSMKYRQYALIPANRRIHLPMCVYSTKNSRFYSCMSTPFELMKLFPADVKRESNSFIFLCYSNLLLVFKLLSHPLIQVSPGPDRTLRGLISRIDSMSQISQTSFFQQREHFSAMQATRVGLTKLLNFW